MSASLAALRASTDLLLDTTRVLELAVEAIDEVCGRGLAFGVMTAGPQAQRAALLRARFGRRFVPITLPHAVHVRTPAFDVADVPAAQRDRWIEPFRDGIATREGFQRSTIYPFIRQFGVLDLGRIVVCAGARQVAMIGVALPEGSAFSDDERARLADVADALVLPVRVAAVLADARGRAGPLEDLVDRSEGALIATDPSGEMVDASRAAALAIRRRPAVLAQIRAAVMAASGPAVARHPEGVLRLAPCALSGSRAAWLVSIDGAFPEAPVPLTARQQELLGLLARGLPNAGIAAAMGLAPSTVKTMLERLYRATGTANRVELVAWACDR